MKKIILIILSFMIILSITIFTSKPKKENIIKVSEVTHSIFYAPWYVAIENKYFEEEDINLEILLTPGADKVAAAVLSNDVQIGFSGPEATIYIYNNSKNKLISFASLTKKDGQFIIGDCNQKEKFTLNNLKNKTILAGRQGGMPLLMFKYALYKSNINEKDITINDSIEFSNLTSAYLSKQGDYVNLFEPNALLIEKQNKGCVLSSLGNITGQVPYTTFYAKEEYIKNNKDTIKKFNKALNKGLNFVKNNDSSIVAKTIKNQFKEIDLNDLTILIERYKKIDAWYNNTYISEEDFNNLQNIMIYGKTLNKKINIKELYTNEFN